MYLPLLCVQMALIAPYMRIPSVLSFLRPRPNVLLSAPLRQVIVCALFEPLAAAPLVLLPAVPSSGATMPATVGNELGRAVEASLGHLSVLPATPHLRRGVLSDAMGMMQVRR